MILVTFVLQMYLLKVFMVLLYVLDPVRKFLQVFPALNQNQTKTKIKTNKGKAAKLPNVANWYPLPEGQSNANQNLPFLETSGPTRQAMRADSCVEHFKLFMSGEIINQIVTETNRYAAENRRPDIRWSDIT